MYNVRLRLLQEVHARNRNCSSIYKRTTDTLHAVYIIHASVFRGDIATPTHLYAYEYRPLHRGHRDDPWASTTGVLLGGRTGQTAKARVTLHVGL